MRLRAAVTIAGAIVLLTGCASTFTTRIVRTAPVPIITDKNGYLVSGPTTLTLSDVDRHAGPARAALRELFNIEWGFTSSSAALVDPVLRAQIGSREIQAGYREMRPVVAEGYPVIRGVTAYGRTEMVSIDIRFAGLPPQPERMLYSYERNRWVSVYNSMMLRGLARAAESDPQPLDRPLSANALNAGNEVQSKYRAVAQSLVGAPLPGPTHA